MRTLARHTARGALGAAALMACVGSVLAGEATTAPFDATADTVFDIIRRDDATHLVCMTSNGRGLRQMWDKRIDGEYDADAFLFVAHFSDTPPVEFVVNPEFQTEAAARAVAGRHARILGQLPALLRSGVERFGIHKGRESFHGGPGKIFVYTGMSDRRDGQDHLEESLFHEAVHATLDEKHATSPAWRAAQDADGAFLTGYGARYPQREDLAESALFAFGLLAHPGRIPPVDSRVMTDTAPARIAVLETILSQAPNQSGFPPPPEDCQ